MQSLHFLKRPFLTVLAVVAVVARLGAAGTVLSREQVEKDLALHVARQSPATIQVGEPVDVAIVLRNHSPATRYSIVVPGDGSASGVREPYVFFTATLDTGDGRTKIIPKARVGYCGLFNPDWQKDVHILQPSEELLLASWLDSPSSVLEFQEPGHVRLFAHYHYRAGVTAAGIDPTVASGPMAGVPAFELVSAPVEFDVVRPLDLVLSVKAPLAVHTKTKVSDLFDVRLVNRSKQPFQIVAPTISADARLSLEIEGEFGGWGPSIDTEILIDELKLTLNPGDEVTLLGSGKFAHGLDGSWEYPVAGVVKVRATFYVSTWQRSASIIRSNWVEIRAVGGERKAR